VAVVVLDTGTRRRLAESAYADRQRSCREAAERLGVAALRDAGIDDLARLPLALRTRARHVISENARTLATAEALTRSDTAAAGRLMTESHRSLRDDFEVSGPALDAVVDAALAHPGCLGARMTGGGFAGGAVALVETEAAPAFVDHVAAAFRPPAAQPAETTPAFWITRPAEGASILRPRPRRPTDD
jgi:galactokinase